MPAGRGGTALRAAPAPRGPGPTASPRRRRARKAGVSGPWRAGLVFGRVERLPEGGGAGSPASQEPSRTRPRALKHDRSRRIPSSFDPVSGQRPALAVSECFDFRMALPATLRPRFAPFGPMDCRLHFHRDGLFAGMGDSCVTAPTPLLSVLSGVPSARSGMDVAGGALPVHDCLDPAPARRHPNEREHWKR